MIIHTDKNAVIYIHGMGGSADEAEHYRPLFPGSAVTGFDYKSQTPREAKEEFAAYFNSLKDKYESVILIANSIGAYFSMLAGLSAIRKAFFISPVVDMEKIILDMMERADVTEEKLKSESIIHTASGETLSWDYLNYVRENPVKADTSTEILYGSGDNLTDYETMRAFADRTEANLTVMEGGEHWFHTPGQMRFLDNWIKERI
ncbi:MAG: alpha/beta hydrolase [Clostridia bacterium]|nr:alpha/beta hydrolase [Clostridia bacterium]